MLICEYPLREKDSHPADLWQVGKALGTLCVAVDLPQLVQRHVKSGVGTAAAVVLPITL